MKGKGKKKRARRKNRNRSQILAYAHERKTKKLLNYAQLAENYALRAGNQFFCHFHGNWPKNGSKRRIWSKISFSPKNWLTVKSLRCSPLTHSPKPGGVRHDIRPIRVRYL